MELLQNYGPTERTIVFRAAPGNGGLGDRVVGAVSALVLAVLTNRKFVIEWNSPFPLEAAWQPISPAIPWNDTTDRLKNPRTLACVGQLPEMSSFFRHEDFSSTAWSECDWIIEANQHFFAYLLQNQSLTENAEASWDLSAEEITAQAMSALFAPSELLAQRIAGYAQRLTRGATLGVQVRTLWNWRDGGGHLTDSELMALVHCASERAGASETQMVFVTADDIRVFPRMRKEFTAVPVFWLPTPILHLDRSTTQDEYSFLDVFVNFHLLTMCDELVISHWSNFGRLAALCARSPTWITQKSGEVPNLPFTDATWRQADLGELVSKEVIISPDVAVTGEKA